MPILLVNHRGEVQPPAEASRRLAAFGDGSFSLRWFPSSATWGLMRAWRDDDPRRALIRSGEVGNDPYDCVLFLPTDCPAEQVTGYLANHIKWLPEGAARNELAALCDALVVENEQQIDRNIAKATEGTDEWIEVRGHRLTDTPRVYNAGIPAPPTQTTTPAVPVVPQKPRKGKR